MAEGLRTRVRFPPSPPINKVNLHGWPFLLVKWMRVRVRVDRQGYPKHSRCSRGRPWRKCWECRMQFPVRLKYLPGIRRYAENSTGNPKRHPALYSFISNVTPSRVTNRGQITVSTNIRINCFLPPVFDHWWTKFIIQSLSYIAVA